MASIDRVMRLRSELEARLLRASVAATVLIAGLGIGMGLLANSRAIVFDGVFSLIDAFVTWLTLVVARLIPEGGNRRFQFGFWHLEPLVIGLKASLLLLVMGYAFVASVTAILRGGYLPDFGLGLVYAGVVAVICFGMWTWMRGEAERIDSGLVRLDVKAWLMSGVITVTLLVAFFAAWMAEGTRLAPLARFADPAILAVLSLLLLPMPLREARTAFLEIFEVVPRALDQAVRGAVAQTLAPHGFTTFETYVQRSGRALFVEVSILTSADFSWPMDKADALRRALAEEIAHATDIEVPDLWLTANLTADSALM